MTILLEEGCNNMTSLQECNNALSEISDYLFKDEDELISSWKMFDNLSNFLKKS